MGLLISISVSPGRDIINCQSSSRDHSNRGGILLTASFAGVGSIVTARRAEALPLVLARCNPRRATLDERTRILESGAGQRRGSVRQTCANLAKDGKSSVG